MIDAPVLLVTGGASGIGRGIVQMFADRDYTVVIADKDGVSGDRLASELTEQGSQAISIATDVRDETSVKALMGEIADRFSKLDCLCNNAGMERYRSPVEYSLDDFQTIVDTNLRGSFLCTKYAFPLLKNAGGTVISISSVQAIASERNISVYASTKAGILGWTRAVALDFAPYGIRVNAVCPGAIYTSMTDIELAESPHPEKMLADMQRNIPLQRIGQPKDIAEVVYFLASSAASYITGTNVVVDGGLLAKLAL